jgi:hypothetical protein
LSAGVPYEVPCSTSGSRLASSVTVLQSGTGGA